MTGVPFTFATATTAIPLSELDVCFATPVTIGGTTVALGNSVSSLTGLANVGMTGNLTYGGVTLLSGVSGGVGNIVSGSEGGWTPVDASGQVTFIACAGFYRKYSKAVQVFGYASYPPTADGSQAAVGGLPFPASALVAGGYPAINIYGPAIASIGVVVAGGSYFGAGGLATGTALQNANWSNRTIYFSGVYPTDT